MDKQRGQHSVIIYNWPGGLSSIAGGTRGEIKLSRPWQKRLKDYSWNCDLCSDLDFFIEYHTKEGGWYFRQNRFTPLDPHYMIIPPSCWSPDELRILGGIKKIEAALEIAYEQIILMPPWPIFITVHMGPLAGQNIFPHLHYHVVRYLTGQRFESLTRSQLQSFYRRRPDLVLFEGDSLLVGVGGIRAGQCYLLPKSTFSVSETAEILSRLIALYNRKFLSTEGLPPEFCISLYFLDTFQYGIYTPILNQLGGSEQIASQEGGAIALPWPHEATVQYLKS